MNTFADTVDVVVPWALNSFLNVVCSFKYGVSPEVSVISMAAFISSKTATVLFPKFACANLQFLKEIPLNVIPLVETIMFWL
jgi:hypothetical protein